VVWFCDELKTFFQCWLRWDTYEHIYVWSVFHFWNFGFRCTRAKYGLNIPWKNLHKATCNMRRWQTISSSSLLPTDHVALTRAPIGSSRFLGSMLRLLFPTSLCSTGFFFLQRMPMYDNKHQVPSTRTTCCIASSELKFTCGLHPLLEGDEH
jgi:hypothetical protein